MDRLKNSSHPLIIAGAGIGGLGAALALAKRGYPSRVLEQAPEIKEVGAGIQLGPNSWRCLRELGVEPAVKRFAVFPQALVMMDAVTGEQVVSIPLGGFESWFKAPRGLNALRLRAASTSRIQPGGRLPWPMAIRQPMRLRIMWCKKALASNSKRQ